MAKYAKMGKMQRTKVNELHGSKNGCYGASITQGKGTSLPKKHMALKPKVSK